MAYTMRQLRRILPSQAGLVSPKERQSLIVLSARVPARVLNHAALRVVLARRTTPYRKAA